ncbi:MAG TPA: CinA family protein [Candidatus Ornithoclostridium excrementipullorum]|nr:CinA family protein [Candidatus Ornithoclostridium excrementipullorum]
MKEYRNICVLKAFELDEKQSEALKNMSSDGVFADITENEGDFTVTVASETDEIAFNDAVNDAVRICGDRLYDDSGQSLASKVVETLAAEAKTLSVAESFTGGMICSDIVGVSGASAVLYEGAVTYSANAKIRRLHVKARTLETYGAASRQVCAEMLDGLISTRMTDYAIATTGCAGPDTDEFGTPVGRCFIGVADRNEKQVFEYDFDEDRNGLRRRAANTALWQLLAFSRNKNEN